MAPPLAPCKPHFRSLLVHKQRTCSRHTKAKPPCSVGTWWEAVFPAEHCKEAASICINTALVQIAWFRFPERAEAGPWWGRHEEGV